MNTDLSLHFQVYRRNVPRQREKQIQRTWGGSRPHGKKKKTHVAKMRKGEKVGGECTGMEV